MLIELMSKEDNLDAMLGLLDDMEKSCVFPDKFVYNTFIVSFEKVGKIDMSWEFLKKCIGKV